LAIALFRLKNLVDAIEHIICLSGLGPFEFSKVLCLSLEKKILNLKEDMKIGITTIYGSLLTWK